MESAQQLPANKLAELAINLATSRNSNNKVFGYLQNNFNSLSNEKIT